MPVYEFYCRDCHTIYSFFSTSVNTTKTPLCPGCKRDVLQRRISLFSVTGKAKETDEYDDLPFDEERLEKAMGTLEREAGKIDENDPRQAADMVRKLSDMTGLKLGEGMNEALARLERGEDPEKIEAEMGDLMDSEEPFALPGKRRIRDRLFRREPKRDENLYDL